VVVTTIPKWPDFQLEVGPEQLIYGSTIYRASTDTGRPGTPIFTVLLTAAENLPESLVRQMASRDLWDAFRRAHPNGCPGSHA
jgi:hypothetical protein